ncbi:MAG: hypothetical protein K5864_03395 [Bacteroidales bacterium]|nr:hypothetical protein [Bacteroidales bacterium]
MDEAFYNAAEMASEEICDCESPSMCMETIIERFTDYKDSKEFRDEVLRRVMECRKYKEHFAEAVDVVAKELCDEGNPTEKLDEITEELYPKYGYQDDPKFRQKAIDKAQECLNKKAPKPVKTVKTEPYDPKKDPNYKPPI